jgi:uncharacterized repeat protein (TIGR03803 family)
MRKLAFSKMTLSVVAFFLVTVVASTAQTLESLSLNGTDGNQPSYEFLIQGTNGNFYGTTYLGGKHNGGTVFEVTTTGKLTVLYNFCSETACGDGAYPYGGLVQGSGGNFYGTTSFGGANNGGTVFEVTSEGALTTLYNFCAQTDCNDGYVPSAALIQGSNGNFYGTTQDGGANGGGTVFEITPAGVLTTLYSFCEQTACTDGENPWAPVLQTSSGNLYGTTSEGGGYKAGEAFVITSAGKFAVLRGFNRIQSGANPYAGLVLASNGDFYGVTSEGGPSAQFNPAGGTFFQLTTGGAITILYSFCAQTNCTDGSLPLAGLIQGSNGNFYGTASSGGANNSGTVFEFTSAGALTTLYNFCSRSNCTDGSYPYSGLFQASNGALIGTTWGGGSDGDGTLFSLTAAAGAPSN